MSIDAGKNEPMELFPVPKPHQSVDLPTSAPLAGATPASTEALQEVLHDNHKRWHCFFNDRGFHNHISHSALALWYLGADADIIKAMYTQESTYQRSSYASPGPVNKDNWTEHLGDEKYYNAYLAFFTAELAAQGPHNILEEYVFSTAANFPAGEKKVEMLNRFTDGLIHPLIHAGYGYELGIPGMIVEGLSQAAVHPATSSVLIPGSLWKESPQGVLNSTPSALNVLARVLADTEITAPKNIGLGVMYIETIEQNGQRILKHVNTWSPHLSTKEGLQKALEEVAWFVTLIYAVGGSTSKEGGTFNADFFLMHLVTSSMFLPSVAVHLKPESQELLLKSYVSVCLGWFVSRGKPDVDIEAFLQDGATLKSLITTTSTHKGPSFKLPASTQASPNPWTEVIDLSIVHPDDHVPKLQRTLLHYGRAYGARKAGHFKGVELKGAEKLDGTLFVRAANLSARRFNQDPVPMMTPGGQFLSYWDRRGFYSELKRE